MRWLDEVGMFVWRNGMVVNFRRDGGKQQAALETGTGTETVVDCNRNCEERTKFLYTFFLGVCDLPLLVWETDMGWK